MISVENLYWVLYNNLLKPVSLDCSFYYPFGTTDSLIKDIYGDPGFADGHGMVLFHYDQEPIYEQDQYRIYQGSGQSYNWYQIPRLLANSEISTTKDRIIQDQQLLDWYYFYHGFASLDWFRDLRYINSNCEISNAYCSFNHLVRDKRSYRMSLLARLSQQHLIDLGSVSFKGDWNDCMQEIARSDSPVSERSKSLIKQYLVDPRITDITADSNRVDSTFSARIGVEEHRFRQRSFLQLVNETVFYEPKLHLTEKTFHAIVCARPFVLVAAPGALQYLKSYGFQTFDAWIDESYDSCLDADSRLDMIAKEVERFAKMSISDLKQILKDMKPVLDFNKHHFFSTFKHFIVDEMVDNFDQCIRQWNNGRLKYRIATHPDLDQVKHLLKS